METEFYVAIWPMINLVSVSITWFIIYKSYIYYKETRRIHKGYIALLLFIIFVNSTNFIRMDGTGSKEASQDRIESYRSLNMDIPPLIEDNSFEDKAKSLKGVTKEDIWAE